MVCSLTSCPRQLILAIFRQVSAIITSESSAANTKLTIDPCPTVLQLAAWQKWRLVSSSNEPPSLAFTQSTHNTSTDMQHSEQMHQFLSIRNYNFHYLGNMFVVAEDVDLLDGQFTSSFNIVTQEHLTKPTNAQYTPFLPICWRHSRYTQQRQSRFANVYDYRLGIAERVLTHPCL